MTVSIPSSRLSLYKLLLPCNTWAVKSRPNNENALVPFKFASATVSKRCLTMSIAFLYSNANAKSANQGIIDISLKFQFRHYFQVLGSGLFSPFVIQFCIPLRFVTATVYITNIRIYAHVKSSYKIHMYVYLSICQSLLNTMKHTAFQK